MKWTNSLKTILALLLLSPLGLVTASPAAQTEASDTATTATEDTTRTSLWKIQGENNAVYLLGSVNALTEDSYPLPEAMQAAYKDCPVVALETDLDEAKDQNKIQEMVFSRGFYPEGVTLNQALPEDVYNKLLEATSKAGIPMSQIERLKPWILAVQLRASEFNALGYKQEYGVDQHFFDLAKADEKKRIYFETLDYRFNLLAGMNDQLQAQMLAQVLDELGQIAVRSEMLRQAWRKGDGEKLDELVTEQFQDYPRVKSRLLTQRNRKWAPEIEKLLAQEDNCLVVVGVMHLIGKKGVVQMLQDKGYEVTQL